MISRLLERSAKGMFSSRGVEYLQNQIREAEKNGLLDQAAECHAEVLGLRKCRMRADYWDFWADWHPGSPGYSAEIPDEVWELFQKNKFSRDRLTGKGLGMYLAARGGFRCYYTLVPLLPTKASTNQPIYAWHPSLDHVDATCQEPERSKLGNMCICGAEVNRVFGSLTKGTCRKLMASLASAEPISDARLIATIGRESLQNSGRAQ